MARSHGVGGEVVVELVTDRVERLAPGSTLVAGAGPLRVMASRPHRNRWIVRFEGVGDRTAAERLHGAVLRAAPLDDPDALWVHQLIGCEVHDAEGAAHGRVVAVEANPASDLLVLDDGALVPLRFVTDTSAGRIVVDVPRGLFG